MKIRKFNESVESYSTNDAKLILSPAFSIDELDTEYIDDCFVSLADDYPGYVTNLNGKYSLDIVINLDDEYTTPYFSCSSAEDMIRILEYKVNLISEIRYCLDKVKTKYDELSYSIFFDEHENMDEGTGKVSVTLYRKGKGYTDI